ncbi:MAG: ornithine cyclodeaminase family protein [Firmicutes bacterium]|nr:ornithine cyclodeaminase family protein [Bacillota bacterium]
MRNGVSSPAWKPGHSILFLSRRDVAESITMTEAIEAAAAAYGSVSGGTAQVPVRTPIRVDAHGGVSLFMPGYVPASAGGATGLRGASGGLGMKMASVFPGNTSKGLPTILAAVLLVDPETGAPACLMEGAYLTALRTGAAAAVAALYMSRPESSVVAVFGAGGQARMQILGLLDVRRIVEIRIFDPARDRAEALAAEISQVAAVGRVAPGFKCVVAPGAREAVDGADIVVTATTSSKPVFRAEWLKPGAHINGIGSFRPDMQEVGEDTVVRAARVIVDSREAALEEAGDVIIPLRKGLITSDRIAGEIGDLVLGRLRGRQSPDEITFAKMVGLSALDVSVGSAVFRRALESGRGTVLPL